MSTMGAGRRSVLRTWQGRATTVLTLAFAGSAFAQPPGMGGTGAQMPDARQMSGVPLPVGDVPVGTVTVRVVRGAMTNPLKGETVTLTGVASPQTATTDDSGRATF